MVFCFQYKNVCLLPELAKYINCSVEFHQFGHVRLKETKLNDHLKEHQYLLQMLWEIAFFCLVRSSKSHWTLYFVFKTQVLIFSTFRKFVCSLPHWEFSQIMIYSLCKCFLWMFFERVVLVLQCDLPWSILDMSGDHWCRWRIILNLRQILEAL